MCIQLLSLLCLCFAGGIAYPLPDKTVWLRMLFQQMQFWDASATILSMATGTDGYYIPLRELFCRSCSAGDYIKWCAVVGCRIGSSSFGNVTKQKVAQNLPNYLLLFFSMPYFLNQTMNPKIVKDHGNEFCIIVSLSKMCRSCDQPAPGSESSPYKTKLILIKLTSILTCNYFGCQKLHP